MSTDWAPAEVTLGSRSVDQLNSLVGADRLSQLREALAGVRVALNGRVVWNVSSTPTGGGVAEILRGLLPYLSGAGIATRWLVIGADPAFFQITKRIHHALHGSAGDRSVLGCEQRQHYEEVLEANAGQLLALVRPGDPVILHDPQTAGLIPSLKSHGARIVWRCHIGTDDANQESLAGWEFLLPYVTAADILVFSRRQYVPLPLGSAQITIIPPSLDPLAAKNREMTPVAMRAILVHTGIIEAPDGVPKFLRDDGSQGRVERRADIVRLGRAPAWDRPIVLQISRWDPLKDHLGVMQAFVELLTHSATDACLILAGPNVHGVADDPEQASVLDELIDSWRTLSHSQRSQIDLVCLPTADSEENAAIVNALQRHASVVVQKSLAEGFGLTVTEAMWKRRAVVASAVGGITDQIEDGVSGLLLQDPRDEAGLSAKLQRLLEDPDLAGRLGAAAHERVRDEYLVTRQLLQYADLLTRLVA
jgi:Glycosyltransferase